MWALRDLCLTVKAYQCEYCVWFTHSGVSAGLGIGADASSNVFGHTALMDCVLAYCQRREDWGKY